ncbi:MAG: branched-chain amino acid transaminase [Pseudomonadales bacterium]|nr:branched-chain amino acid transaminase [Caldilineaceae bacterium]MCP5180953.1 branched-chain amino acid transaminase [Pseudomonadales bacterium]MCP5183340.1 branched-chain amino acid transaminase [Pseudomonadales bacterium]
MTASTFADRDGFIWQDGALVPWRDARVHVLTHSLHYGVGVFEGVRCYDTPKGPQVFRLTEHTDRLFKSAHILGLKIPYTQAQINAAHVEVLRANKLDEGYIRPLVFLGSEAMGLRAKGLTVRTAIAAWEWPNYMDPDSREKGIRVRTSSYTRHHVNITMCKAKATGNYTNSILALHEALDAGCDEALLLDPEGYVAEGSGENVFIVRNGELHTPELTSCLDGITRNTVFTLARELGYTIHERRITRDEVYIADEAFFTGTAAEVLPIRELDGRTIGSGRRGPVTERLQTAYFDQVRGRSAKHAEWHTSLR